MKKRGTQDTITNTIHFRWNKPKIFIVPVLRGVFPSSNDLLDLCAVSEKKRGER
jgi:hypothetical protein